MHGLNLDPRKMDALSRALADSGIEAYRPVLSGHGIGSFAEVTPALWLSETLRAYQVAAERSAALDVPLFFVGYSLGGLLGEVLLSEGQPWPGVHFKRVVLLAPAIALRPVTNLVKLLFPLGRAFSLPSADNPAYRAHPGTPMAAYEALFALLHRLHAEASGRANLPTLLFARRNDELVSFRGLEALMKAKHLTNWSLVAVPDATPAGYPHHLIIDEASLGAHEWRRMQTQLRSFLLRGER